MTRNPSIHITESSLKKILEELSIDSSKAIDILRKARKYKANNRGVVNDTQKLDKKIEKIVKASTNDVFVFNNILFMVRKSNNHFGIRKIEETSREWLVLKDITKLAVDFCNEFELDRVPGFNKFCQIGMSKMNKFSLIKFKQLYEAICNSYVAKLELDKDSSPGITKAIHDFYVSLITQKTGNPTDYTKDPDNYTYFYLVKKEVEKLGVKFQDYIRAQFQGMEWRDTIPHPAQLVGSKANDRLNSYLYEKGIKINKGTSNSSKKNILADIKNMK